MMAYGVDRKPTGHKGLLVAAIALWLIFFVVLATPLWNRPVHHAIELVGILLVAACVCGRVVCAIYISGHKTAVLIEKGPYSVCRNPLYTFSIVGAAGIGASTGSILAGLTGALLTYAVFARVARREERVMEAAHGERYCAYRKRVPSFIPNFGLWQAQSNLVVSKQGVLRTFADSSLFFVAVPVIDLIEHLKHVGAIRALVEIP